MKSVNKEAIWERWCDVNNWHEWIPNVDYCRLEKPFQTGSQFTLKPKGFPAVIVQLSDVKKGQQFTGCTRFFGATMYDTHEMQETPEGIRLTVTVKVTGPLGFLWRMLVAGKIANNLPTLLKNLANVASTPALKKVKPKAEITLESQEIKSEAASLKKPKPKPSSLPLKKAKTRLGKTLASASKKAALSPKPVAATVKKPQSKTSASSLKKDKSELKDSTPQKTKAKPKASAPKKAKVSSKPKSKLKAKQ
jgi:hypothetical protein